MKKVIILWHNGGRLANQLWQFISIYAYCLEKGYKIENHCFFEFSNLFDIKPNNAVIDLLFHKPYTPLKKILPKKLYTDPHDYFFRTYYKLYVKIIKKIFEKNIIYAKPSKDMTVRYLPPSDKADKEICEFENNNESKMYLIGWMFKNPIGIEKYRKKIKIYFSPKKNIKKNVNKFIENLKLKYDFLVGVHFRQGDYKNIQEGALRLDETKIKKTLEEYIEKFNINKEKTCFIICSDGKVNEKIFKDLNVTISRNPAIEDLFILSKTDTIIGSDSTFGAFASYYGNTPIIVLKKEEIDWNYYLDKNKYFENKYLTSARY